MAERAPGCHLQPYELRSQGALRELMIRYQQADPVATEQLVQRLSPMLYRFLSRPVATRTESEDLLQECWLRIHKARHTYTPDLPVLPWIYAIARHTRLDGYRRHRRVQARESSIEQHTELALTPESAWLARQDLAEALDGLPESQRAVFLMLKVSGMSLEEVAQVTSSTVGAVKLKAHRAYEALRRLLGRAGA